MEAVATQQDVKDLRSEFTRQFEHHTRDDDRRFGELNAEVQSMNKQIAEAMGAFGLIRWMVGIGVPAIIGGIVTPLLRQHP